MGGGASCRVGRARCVSWRSGRLRPRDPRRRRVVEDRRIRRVWLRDCRRHCAKRGVSRVRQSRFAVAVARRSSSDALSNSHDPVSRPTPDPWITAQQSQIWERDTREGADGGWEKELLQESEISADGQLEGASDGEMTDGFAAAEQCVKSSRENGLPLRPGRNEALAAQVIGSGRPATEMSCCRPLLSAFRWIASLVVVGGLRVSSTRTVAATCPHQR